MLIQITHWQKNVYTYIYPSRKKMNMKQNDLKQN